MIAQWFLSYIVRIFEAGNHRNEKHLGVPIEKRSQISLEIERQPAQHWFFSFEISSNPSSPPRFKILEYDYILTVFGKSFEAVVNAIPWV